MLVFYGNNPGMLSYVHFLSRQINKLLDSELNSNGWVINGSHVDDLMSQGGMYRVSFTLQ